MSSILRRFRARRPVPSSNVRPCPFLYLLFATATGVVGGRALWLCEDWKCEVRGEGGYFGVREGSAPALRRRWSGRWIVAGRGGVDWKCRCLLKRFLRVEKRV